MGRSFHDLLDEAVDPRQNHTHSTRIGSKRKAPDDVCRQDDKL